MPEFFVVVFCCFPLAGGSTPFRCRATKIKHINKKQKKHQNLLFFLLFVVFFFVLFIFILFLVIYFVSFCYFVVFDYFVFLVFFVILFLFVFCFDVFVFFPASKEDFFRKRKALSKPIFFQNGWIRKKLDYREEGLLRCVFFKQLIN